MAAAALSTGPLAPAAGGGRGGRRGSIEQDGVLGEGLGGVGVAEAAEVRVDVREVVLAEGEGVERGKGVDDLVRSACQSRFRGRKGGFATVRAREWLRVASNLGDDGLVVGEGVEDALDDGGAEQRRVAGGGEAEGRRRGGEARCKSRERAAFGLPVLDNGDGDGGVHGGEGLAGGGDDHQLVDDRGEGIPDPLQEGASAQASGGLVGAEAAAQPARDDDAGNPLWHGVRVREQGSL